MEKVFGIALLASIVGCLMGRVLGSAIGGPESQNVVLNVFTAIGWGSGGIIGALAGVGSILREGYQNQGKMPK